MKWSFQSVDAGSAHAARSGLLAYLKSRADGSSDLEAAIVIFGELVGNVVRHAPGPISIELTWDRNLAVLRVADKGPGCTWKGPGLPEDMTAESGRGLFIANSLAVELQVESQPDRGTLVTAWLPVRLDERLRSTAC